MVLLPHNGPLVGPKTLSTARMVQKMAHSTSRNQIESGARWIGHRECENTLYPSDLWRW
jgi:hypothetical protein